MSALFRNQVIAGHSIGASPYLGALLIFITWSLVAINAYHMANFLSSKLTTIETGFIVVWALYVAGAGIAALEIPLGKSLVTTYRLHGLTFAVIIQAMLAVVIASMAVFAGVNSQLADADRRDTQSQAYSVSASSFANMKQSAEIRRDAMLRRAEAIQDANSREIAKLEANAAYQDKLVSIAQQESTNTLKKPVTMFKSESDEQYVTIMLFSIVCSFGALFCSGFSAIYVSPLVSMPAFSLKAKANHDWQSDGSDFKSAQHQLSPLANKFTGFLQREKVPAMVANTAFPERSTSGSNKVSSESLNNRPRPLDTQLRRGLNNSSESSERSLNEPKKSDKVDYSESHYAAIKRDVIAGSIKPVQKAVKTALVKLKVRFVDDAARQKKAVEILERLKAESVIIDNPKFGQSGKMVAMYLRNDSYQEQGAGKYSQLSEPVTCICPECKQVEVVAETTPKGKVRSSCGAVYVAADNLEPNKSGWKVKPVAGAGVAIGEDGINPIAGIGALVSK